MAGRTACRMEERIENMKEYKVGQKHEEGIIKVYLNPQDDYILLDQNDARTVERYTKLIEWFDRKQAVYRKDAEDFSRTFKDRKMVEEKEDGEIKVDTEQLLAFSKLHVGICRECCEKIDELLGADTVRKYFRASYEIAEDFIPDEDCILDFFEEMAPIFGEIFGKRTSQLKSRYSKNRKGSHTKSKEEMLEEYKEKKEADADE